MQIYISSFKKVLYVNRPKIFKQESNSKLNTFFHTSFLFMFHTVTLILIRIICYFNWTTLLTITIRSISQVNQSIALTKPNGKTSVCFLFDRLKKIKCLFYHLTDDAIFSMCVRTGHTVPQRVNRHKVLHPQYYCTNLTQKVINLITHLNVKKNSFLDA